MRMLLTLDVDVHQPGLKEYYEEWPGFVEDGEAEHVEQTLCREAATLWDELGFLAPASDVQLVEENRSIFTLAEDLYNLALKAHCQHGLPCDPDLECQDCTLLIIAAGDLNQADPFAAWHAQEASPC